MMLKRSDDMTQFQSTLSMRRATLHRSNHSTIHIISIHALHEESDSRETFGGTTDLDFNPRSP